MHKNEGLKILKKEIFKTFWIEALAGSGKTTFLVHHLVHLLLNPQAPWRILCLTFTKKAALHWENCLYAVLKELALCAPEKLEAHLLFILKRAPSSEEQTRARVLLKEVESSSPFFGTLHSFCHHLLRTQGIDSEVIDEIKANDFWLKACKAAQKKWDTETPLGQMALHVWKTHGAFVPERLDRDYPLKAPLPFVPPPNPFDSTLDQEPFIEKTKKCPRFDPDYCHLFLTKEGKKRVFKLKNPLLALWIEKEQDILQTYNQWQKSRDAFIHQEKLLMLTRDIQEHYAALKGTHLDFEDLVVKTLSCLEDETTAGPLAHSIDAAWDHVLLDEAQDTSMLQWRLVRHLAEILLVSPEKTFCVVGDSKQSIYGFQGADIETFSAMKDFLKAWVEIHGGLFETKKLDVSFRSGQGILDFINRVFSGMSLGITLFSAHKSALGIQGTVEVMASWKTQEEACAFWMEQICQWIETPFYLEAHDRMVGPQDILILLPRRNSLFKSLQQDLSQRGLLGVRDGLLKEAPVMGVLLPLFHWLLNPYDEEMLASVLQGPLFAMSDTLLGTFSRCSRKNLWTHLQKAFTPHPSVKILQSWQAQRSTFSLPDLFIKIVSDFKASLVRDARSVHDLHLFLDMLNAWPEHASWIEFLDMIAHKKATHLPSYPGVGLMTIHGAKGLESPVVILPDLPQAVGQENEEYWRLLYVALTRAQSHLYLQWQEGNQGWASRIQEVLKADSEEEKLLG